MTMIEKLAALFDDETTTERVSSGDDECSYNRIREKSPAPVQQVCSQNIPAVARVRLCNVYV